MQNGAVKVFQKLETDAKPNLFTPHCACAAPEHRITNYICPVKMSYQNSVTLAFCPAHMYFPSLFNWWMCSLTDDPAPVNFIKSKNMCNITFN